MVLMNKGLEIRIYPQDELIGPIHQNIGNARFVWNNVLSRYNKMYEESKETDKEVYHNFDVETFASAVSTFFAFAELLLFVFTLSTLLIFFTF